MSFDISQTWKKIKRHENRIATHNTPWCRLLFEKLIVTQLFSKYPALFMEPEGSLPCSQKPATGPYPEPADSSSPPSIPIPLPTLIKFTFILWNRKTVILPVVLYGCETWSLTLREEHRLRAFENRVLRGLFGPKREEDGSWRKLHNDELHNLYSSPDIVRMIKSRRMRWSGHVARMGEGRGVYRVLVRPKSKRPLGRPGRRWEDNIKMDLREIGIDGTN
jgi:hypothetical protein